ncbi:hypothetical protein niasHS_010017 [Heterodera schachtii]|uniref:Uncharacterized protein n=1 Tax=Heterodera schachtii TaxID=97005 RepID=A0ABD2J6W6_HETSC
MGRGGEGLRGGQRKRRQEMAAAIAHPQSVLLTLSSHFVRSPHIKSTLIARSPRRRRRRSTKPTTKGRGTDTPPVEQRQQQKRKGKGRGTDGQNCEKRTARKRRMNDETEDNRCHRCHFHPFRKELITKTKTAFLIVMEFLGKTDATLYNRSRPVMLPGGGAFPGDWVIVVTTDHDHHSISSSRYS